MFQNQIRLIGEALRLMAPKGQEGSADAVTRALSTPGQKLEHKGDATFQGAFSAQPRGYGSVDGELKPRPPIGPPVIDAARVKVVNAANGMSDRTGDNGFAADYEGIVRTDQLWGIRWCTVDSVGMTAEGYYYSDGYECETSTGGGLTETPIRLFHQEQSPAVGEVVGYMRDRGGLPYGVSNKPLPTPPGTGFYALTATNGELGWTEIEDFACP